MCGHPDRQATFQHLISDGSISILETAEQQRQANTAPPPLASRSSDEAYYEQHDDCADRGVDDRTHDAPADIDAQPRQQPAADKGADNADNDIAD